MSKHFGDRLRALMKQKGVKILDLCFFLGVHPSNFGHVLNGKRKPDKLLEKISQYEPLGISLKTLQAWLCLDDYSTLVILEALNISCHEEETDQ